MSISSFLNLHLFLGRSQWKLWWPAGTEPPWPRSPGIFSARGKMISVHKWVHHLCKPPTDIIFSRPVFNDSLSFIPGGIMVLEKNLKVNLNVPMKVRMINGLFIKMSLDVQMYPFWLILPKRTCLGTTLIKELLLLSAAWVPLLHLYQIRNMQWMLVVRSSYQSIPELPACV